MFRMRLDRGLISVTALLLVVVVMSPRNAQALDVRVIAVECDGSCADTTLGYVCDSQIGWNTNYAPIAVDCGDVQEVSSPRNPCGGNNRCSQWQVRREDFLGRYCDDGTGWDAHVYCAK